MYARRTSRYLWNVEGSVISSAAPWQQHTKRHIIQSKFMRHTACQQKKHARDILFSVCSLRDNNVITGKPTWKLKNTNSILESFEFFCKISSKLILIILSYTASKLVLFFEIQCISQWHELLITEIVHVKCNNGQDRQTNRQTDRETDITVQTNWLSTSDYVNNSKMYSSNMGINRRRTHNAQSKFPSETSSRPSFLRSK